MAHNEHVQELTIQNNLPKPPQVLSICCIDDVLHTTQLRQECGLPFGTCHNSFQLQHHVAEMPDDSRSTGVIKPL